MSSLGKSVLLLAALCLVFGLAVMTVEAGPTERKCDNGKDDDRDGDIDCNDPDCAADPACGGAPPPPPDNCQLQFNGDFENGETDFVESDGLACIGDPDNQYCDRDQKVFMGFSISGGDGDPRAIFAFDSNTGPVKTRKGEVVRQAWIDLSDFTESVSPNGQGCWVQDDGTELDPFESDCSDTAGLKPFVSGFYSGRGGLDLCAMCVKGDSDCTPADDAACYMGHELDVGWLGGVSCAEGESSWRGAVGLYLNFPVEGSIWDKMAVIYNPRWSGFPMPGQCPGAKPGVVERIALDKWTITGTLGCLISGGASGWDVLDDLGAANFTLTITTQD